MQPPVAKTPLTSPRTPPHISSEQPASTEPERHGLVPEMDAAANAASLCARRTAIDPHSALLSPVGHGLVLALDDGYSRR